MAPKTSDIERQKAAKNDAFRFPQQEFREMLFPADVPVTVVFEAVLQACRIAGPPVSRVLWCVMPWNSIGRRYRALLAAFAVCADPQTLLAAPEKTLDHNAAYEHCLASVKRDAAAGLTEAEQWSAAGGGAAALDCAALALAQLKRYGEAAQTLENAARITAALAAKADLLDQAGNAWLLAEDPAKAESTLTSANALAPKDEDILTDRARARGAAKNWSGAFADLTAVIALDPDRADIYVLRASALHAEGKKAEARADIAHALAIYPGYPEALVERGAMRLETGDTAGARADWQDAAREAPDSDAGQTARARLNALPAAVRHPEHSR
jgi:tetratricopeptide (TPR) repeat protein